MTSSPIPPAPDFRASLALATVADLPRIAIVASRGFFTSQVFQFERPLHARYPEDTVEDYHRAFAKRIREGEWVVVVALDVVEEEGPMTGQRVVVGVCSWQLPEESRRVGQFQPDQYGQDKQGGSEDEWVSRDKIADRIHRVDSAISTAYARHFHPAHSLIVDRLVVHPSYQRRGHGRALVSWGLQLAKIDHLHIGTVVSNMGQLLFEDMGFENLETLKVEGDGESHGEGDEEMREGIEVVVVAHWRSE